jgi:DNA-binding cell septation regulator SpoVG
MNEEKSGMIKATSGGSEPVRTFNGIYVSECKVFTIEGGRTGFIGFVKIVLNNSILVDCIELHQTTEGKYFLKFPVQENPANGRDAYSLCHPINVETNKLFLDAVVKRLKFYTKGERLFSQERQDGQGECITR